VDGRGWERLWGGRQNHRLCTECSNGGSDEKKDTRSAGFNLRQEATMEKTIITVDLSTLRKDRRGDSVVGGGLNPTENDPLQPKKKR